MSSWVLVQANTHTHTQRERIYLILRVLSEEAELQAALIDEFVQFIFSVRQLRHFFL